MSLIQLETVAGCCRLLMAVGLGLEAGLVGLALHFALRLLSGGCPLRAGLLVPWVVLVREESARDAVFPNLFLMAVSSPVELRCFS